MEEKMEKLESTSLDIEKENIEKLKQLFPNIVSDGRIDFDMLRAILGEEIEESREKYQFTWNGKGNAIKIAQSPSTSTLRPLKEKSKDWDFTKNLYIEGDNLEVLKLLQKTYHGKIKMIYIDPPYNTGHDFVYQDNYHVSISNYEKQTNQSQKSNPESSGRFHTNWLNMMYPRLLLSRNLLKNDGVIFISIDDNEFASLKLTCDEIFGGNNYVTDLIWQHSVQSNGYGGKFVNQYNHTLIYSKSEKFKVGLLPRSEEDNKLYKNPDNDPKGAWRAGYCVNGLYRPNLKYVIKTPSGKTINPPEKGWRWSKATLEEKIQSGEIIFNEDETSIIHKLYLSDLEGKVPENIWASGIAGTTRQATNELKELFGGRAPFDTPKPVELIKRIISLSVSNDDLILDFFSGSATTAHAVIEKNVKDGSHLKYIMVQLPELTSEGSEAYTLGFKNLCDIGEERIRRAGEKIKKEWKEKNKSEGMFAEEKEFPVDIGFKVFKLDSSNIEAWDNERELSNEGLMKYSNEVFKEGRSKEDVLYEIMLKYGIFDREVSEININGKTMYQVGKRYMIVCLDDNLTEEDIYAIGDKAPNTVVFKESGFKDDNAKINAVYNLEKAGVKDIKCI